MRRPWLVNTAAVIQAIGAVALSGVVIYLLVLANHARRLDAQEEAYGLVVGAVVLGAIALPVIVSCWGMWKGKAWSWWLALVVDSLGLAVFLRDPIARRRIGLYHYLHCGACVAAACAGAQVFPAKECGHEQ